MQKKIIALAVAGLVSGAAFAQSNSNVTIYGQMRVSVDSVNFEAPDKDVTQVSDQASRIGFKGEEDLGGGLKAIWQWESTLNNTNNAAAITSRNTFLGLQGGFGKVLAGTHDTPYKLGGSADLYGDTAVDAQCSSSTNGTCIIGRNGFDNRLTNVLAYISPTWSGFNFAIAGSAGETHTANQNASSLADAYSMSAMYANGPLKASLSHEARKVDLIGTTAANNQKAVGTKLNLGYKIGDIGLGYTIESTTDVTATLVPRTKDRSQLASVSYAMGATTLGLQVGKFDDRGTGTKDVTSWTIGAYHALSKRTQAYAAFQSGKLEGVNNDVKILTTGLNHTF